MRLLRCEISYGKSKEHQHTAFPKWLYYFEFYQVSISSSGSMSAPEYDIVRVFFHFAVVAICFQKWNLKECVDRRS